MPACKDHKNLAFPYDRQFFFIKKWDGKKANAAKHPTIRHPFSIIVRPD